MVASFGFGVGDFITVANLAQAIAQSLGEARGAAAQYASLIELLRSISSSLSTIISFLAGSSTCVILKPDDAFINGICFHVDCCSRLMSNFLGESKHYTASLFNGQGSRAKIAFRKVTWFMYRAEDAVKLEQRLQSHLDALHRYLTVFNIQIQAQSGEKGHKKLEGLSRTLDEVHTLVKISHENRPNTLGYPWETSMDSHIGFEDALGRKVILPDVLCRNAQSFQDTIQIMFKDHPCQQTIMRGNYEIVIADTGELLLRPGSSSSGYERMGAAAQNHWERTVLPGTKLAMNIINRKVLKNSPQSLVPNVSKDLTCPYCGWESIGAGLRKCQNCNKFFKYSIVEGRTSGARIPEDDPWPQIVFCRKLMATNAPRFTALLSAPPSEISDDDHSLISGAEGGTFVDNVKPAPGNDEHVFRRVHYLLEHLVPQRLSWANRFDNSRMPLIQAAAQGDARWVQEILLTSDIDPDMRSFQGWTALQQACSTKDGQVEAVVKLLIKYGADVNAAPGHGFSLTALQTAREGGRNALVELILSFGEDIKAFSASAGFTGLPCYTALGVACFNGHKEIIQLLVEQGAQVNRDLQAMGGRSALAAAAEYGSMEIVELLLDYGADINDAVALQTAVSADHEDIVRRLLELGADVNADSYLSFLFWGPNYTAIASARSLSMIKLLLSHGACADGALNHNGDNAAVRRAAACGPTEVLEEFIRLGGDVNSPGVRTNGPNPLQTAAYAGRADHIGLLVVKYGAIINSPRSLEKPIFSAVEAAAHCAARTAYHAARTEAERYDTNDSEESSLEMLDIVEFLLDRGADFTPILLHIAAAWGDESLGELLLKRGADPNVPPDFSDMSHTVDRWGKDRCMGFTVFETARMNGMQQFLVFLQKWCRVHASHLMENGC